MPGRFPLLVFVVVAVAGWAAVAVGALQLEPDEQCGRTLPETSTYSFELALWPPGATRCEYTTPAGSGSYTYVPWEAWLLALSGAAGLAIAVAGRPVVGIPLALTGLGVWFVI